MYFLVNPISNTLLMLLRYSLLPLLLLTAVFARLGAQDFPPEDICVPFGQGLITNVINDNIPVGTEGAYNTSFYEGPCFFIDELGNLSFADSATQERCCGPQQPIVVTVFRVLSDGNLEPIGEQVINLTIKCFKPDCGLVDLEEIEQPEPDPNNENPVPPNCISACENSTATYLFDQVPGYSYDWIAVNGAPNFNPALPGQVTVSWGPLGGASLSVDVYDASGNLLETRTWCVDLTPAPVADFTFTPVVCLDQEVFFTNTSTGAPATFDWKFGDGTTAQNVTNPSHAYTTPGTYTVTLYATSSSTNPDGSEGCCCTDSISYDIMVDPLPGPPIYWISTLCENDQSEYWTDVTGCSSIVWTVSGNGNITSGQGTDRIEVDWGAGPSGTITLAVTDCDIDYCPQPSTAVVPIISSVGAIAGAVDVCKGETVSYELPKWMTVDYQWSTSDPGAVIVSENGGHIVTVTWPTVPGTYDLLVEYGSEFLAGLPGHSGADCTGSAVLSVTVLGDFYITATPNPVCFGDPSFLQGFSDIGFPSYNWTVAGFPGLDATGPTATMNWPGPGIYTVTADVTNPDDYCIDSRSVTVIVKDAVEPTITGPIDYCIGEPIVYQVTSPTPGYDYNWTISGGSISLGNGGPTVTVSFSVLTGAALSVVGVDQGAPNCVSDPAVVNPVTKDFMGIPVITGPAPCTNSTASYGISVPQHADATYTWSVSPITAGSVTANADTPNPTVTWNNGPGSVVLSVDIELCGQILTLDTLLQLSTPVTPNIVQVSSLCPGGTTMLEVDGTQFSSVSWSNGMTGPSITINSPGIYTVSTVDLNGCPGVDQITVEFADGPAVSISLSGSDRICVNNPPFPPNPVLSASTGAANTIEWFCNSISQGSAAIGNTTLTHVWSTDIEVYAYTVVVTDPNGCTNSPDDPILIYQEPCCGAPYVSEPLAQFHTFTAINRTPDCAIVDLVANWSADSVNCHAWDLPRYTVVLGGGGDTIGNIANDSLTIRLPGVGCFQVESGIYQWAYEFETNTVTDPVTGVTTQVTTAVDSIKCGNELVRTVCNPLLAEFDYTENCGEVTFINESLIDFGLTSGPVTYSWDFGDVSGTSTLENPVYPYTANGTYLVTLVVSDGACQSTFTFNVIVEHLPDSDFTLSPNPACYGEPVSFFGTGTDVISWIWDFGDGAVFVGFNPQHTFLPAAGFGTSVVTLTTVNGGGCTDVVSQTIVINPAPAEEVISASNTLIICDGESTTLSVPFVAGHTYLWTNGATGNSITVSTAGTFGLTITSADDCVTEIDAVEVQLIPLPDASWLGNPFICDQGQTTLTASAGGGHTYKWENMTTGAVITTRTYVVNYFAAPPEQDILLTVTNDFGCSSSSIIKVFQVDSPAPVVAITGGSCEGDGSTITVTNPEPDVIYSWSTGASGLSMFTYQAGNYTVIATNTISGCTGSATATINPLPDLCLVPTGCYTSCDPDTLYAPLGNYAYEWFDENGSLLDFDDSTVVSTSGQYYVVVMDLTTFCVATSDPLILEVIDCDSTACDNLVTRLTPTSSTAEEGCCYELTYANLPDGVYAIRASSPDAELTASAVNPALGYSGTPDAFTLEFAIDASLTTELPVSMAGPGVATICPEAVVNNPQTIYVDYLDAEGMVICADTLETFCEPRQECVYVTEDSLYCNDEGGLTFELTICVPDDLEFNIGYIQLMASSAAATAVLPVNLTLFPALLPGECRTLSVSLALMLPGDDFCYTIVGHSGDPDDDPTALCCSDQEPRCLPIPDCSPCDDLFVEGVVPSDEGDCCYDIYLYDGSFLYDFDRVDLCLLGGSGATLNMMTSLGDDLTGTVNTTGTMASVYSTDGSALPNGEVFQLPRICLNDTDQTDYQLEIKWINGDNVLCRDTVNLFCEPDCGYLQEELIVCEGDRYVWSGNIVNSSEYDMSEAHITFPASSGLSAYNTSIDLGGPIAPGGVAFVSFEIGGPAGPGDVICFTVSLHETNDDDGHLNCCNFEACIVMPDCVLEDCSCEGFTNLVRAGVDTLNVGPGPRDYVLQPRNQFSACDVVFWRTRSRFSDSPWTSWSAYTNSYTLNASFDENKAYQVTMRVVRTTPDGEICVAYTYPIFDFREPTDVSRFQPELEIFPNPATDEVTLIGTADDFYRLGGTITLMDMNGRTVRTLNEQQIMDGASRLVGLKGLAPGVYLLRGEGADGVWTKRFVKQ